MMNLPDNEFAGYHPPIAEGVRPAMQRPVPPPEQPPHSSRKRWLIIAVLIAVGAGAWYGGWYMVGKKTTDTGKNKAAPIVVMPVTHANVPVYMTALGTVQAFNTVTVHARVDGELMALKFNEGQMVHKGDVLAKLDDRPFKAQRDQAAANVAKDAALLENTRRDLARYRGMGDSIPRQTLETQAANVKEAEATLASDKAALENAQTQLNYTTITSPLDGRTGIRAVDVGNIVHAADTNGIVVLTQLQPISVIFSLPQQSLTDINAQMKPNSKLKVDAQDGDKQAIIDTGVLELVDNEIDQTTGTIKLKATFPNKSFALWPGGFANIRLLLTTHENVMTIPTVSVQHGPQGAFVFCYDAEQKQVAVVPVAVGVINGEQTEIISGLSDGDKVVTDGMAKLQDKSKVKLSKSSHAKAADAPKDDTTSDAKPEDKAPTKDATDDAVNPNAPEQKPSTDGAAPAQKPSPDADANTSATAPVVHDLSKPKPRKD